jgi:hypothetical protein
MSQYYIFWTHGVAAILDSNEPALVFKHHGGGLGTYPCTVLEQDANTEAWLHIPIPTATIIATPGGIPPVPSLTLEKTFLSGKVNEYAKINRVCVWLGKDNIYDKPSTLIDTEFNESFNNKDILTMQRGLVISAHIKFLSSKPPYGHVEIYGAGASFI